MSKLEKLNRRIARLHDQLRETEEQMAVLKLKEKRLSTELVDLVMSDSTSELVLDATKDSD